MVVAKLGGVSLAELSSAPTFFALHDRAAQPRPLLRGRRRDIDDSRGKQVIDVMIVEANGRDDREGAHLTC